MTGPGAVERVEGTFAREAELPYALDVVDGARHLIVSFPGLTAAAAPPLVEVGRYLGDLRAHRLYVGADPGFLVGPDQQLAGAHTAVHLIWREARRLDVPDEHVVCIGSSFRALCALYIGLKARSGTIVAGAPPSRMGRWIGKLVRGAGVPPEAMAMREAIAAAAGLDGTPERQERLDRLLPRAIGRAEHRADVHLFVSEQDAVHGETVWLDGVLRGHPTLTPHLAIEDYGEHGQIKVPYYRYVRRVTRKLIATGRSV